MFILGLFFLLFFAFMIQSLGVNGVYGLQEIYQ